MNLSTYCYCCLNGHLLIMNIVRSKKLKTYVYLTFLFNLLFEITRLLQVFVVQMNILSFT